MKSVSKFLACLASAVVLGLPLSPAARTTYEAPLPQQLLTDPDLCAYALCREVLPGAESFSPRKGRPSYVEGYRRPTEDRKPGATGEAYGELVGYVFLSTDIVDIPAYSGKPIVTLIGMDTRGIITGVKILRHSEPILLVGIDEAELARFTQQYVGKFVGDKIEIGKARPGEGHIGVDAISGATVTVIAENQTILRSGYEIAKQARILQARERPAARLAPAAEARTWKALLKEGSVRRLSVAPSEIGVDTNGAPYIDLYFGYLNAPAIGTSVLGAKGYRRLMADLKPGEHAIFIVANGFASFKGSGFVRGGIYDRIQVVQEMDTFTFRDTDYLPLYGVHAEGAPEFRESGIFILRGGHFSPAYPWSLVFLANRIDKETGHKAFASFDREYWLPGQYLEGGRPAYQRPDPPWLRPWKARAWEIASFVLLLAATAALYARRDGLVRRANRKDKRWVTVPRYVIWAASVGFVGYYAMAQPSITQVLTWFHSVLYQWRWELFLSDPFIFLFWWFIILTTFFWGRGLFCGWLCPYGALSALAYKVVGALGLKRFQFALPQRVHDRLKWAKYFVFAGLLGVSFYSMGLAERLAEIEPFKTTFLVGVWNRSWPFVAYWGVLFGLALFMERPFCKYLCPLGAGLAVPSTFRFFGLKRKKECTTCKACASGCGSLAIDDKGAIDQRECLLCLDCMILYHDAQACPPLAAERKRREKSGLRLTPIGADGYFVPLEEIRERLRNVATG